MRRDPKVTVVTANRYFPYCEMAELSGLPTPSMDWHAAEPSTALANFKSLCELYFEGPLSSLDDKKKLRYLLIWIGQEGRDIAKSWQLTGAEKDDLGKHWEKFEAYLKPHSNFRVARFKLRNLKQEPNEPVDTFVKRIRLVCADCKYKEPDEHMLDTLIYGINSRSIQSKLFEAGEKTTLQEAIRIVQLREATSRQLNDINDGLRETVHAVHSAPKNRGNAHWAMGAKRPNTRQVSGPQYPKCSNCGKTHKRDERCPAYGSTCRGCGKKNHWVKMCRSPSKETKQTARVHALNESDNGEIATHANDDVVYFHTLHADTASCGTDKNSDKQAFVTLTAKSEYATRDIKCKIDTGAEGNVMPASVYRSLVPTTHSSTETLPGVQPTQTRLIAFGGHTVEMYGTCYLTLTHKERSERCLFHVSKSEGPVLLGLPTCNALQLVTFHYNIDIADNRAESEIKSDMK